MNSGGSFEALAQAIHRRWREQQIKDGKPAETWEELDESRKESSRKHALDIVNKVRAVNAEIIPARDRQASAFSFTPDELERLSIAEHDRWWNERLEDGWTFAPGPKDVVKKTSPYLVPWEDLPPDVADYDRILVRAIPDELASVGLAIIRRQTPDTPTADDTSKPAVDGSPA